MLGQSNFYGYKEDYPELSATTMYEPNAIAVAPDGYVWVIDGDNGRVLGFIPGTSPCSADEFCSGMPASVVIGVQTFTTTSGGTCSSRVLNDTGLCAAEGMTIDSSGNLWIADSFNNRVLEFVPGSSGCSAGQLCTYMAASVVIGQTSFTESRRERTSQCGRTQRPVRLSGRLERKPLGLRLRQQQDSGVPWLRVHQHFVDHYYDDHHDHDYDHDLDHRLLHRSLDSRAAFVSQHLRGNIHTRRSYFHVWGQYVDCSRW